MSRSGDCYDNAMVESFFACLKRELPAGWQKRSRQQVGQLVEDYIVNFYNPVRLHSSLSYLSPAEFEKLHPVLN